MDFLVDGNCFIHYDGTALYYLPAKDMEIVPDEKTYVNHYKFNGVTEFAVNEILHIRDNSANSSIRSYRGSSRINSAMRSILTQESALDFQSKFYDSGAVVGLVIETEAVLNTKLKARKEREWVSKFNPKNGRGNPLILDGGMKAKSVNSNSFRDMDFNASIKEIEDRVAMAIGVPPILLNSGNNANIRPNLELLFSLTIMPMMDKFVSVFEYFFGYDIEATTHNIAALRPDMKAESDRLSSLTNNGILTGDEARQSLRMEPLGTEEMTEIRIPANIAGSATGVAGQQGGKPAANED